jgi:hypothetical protein
MVYFQTKNPNLCKFWWVLQWMMSVYSMAMRSIFLPFYGHLVYFVVIGYILWSLGIFCGHLVYFPRYGKLYQEKSGNPDIYLHAIASRTQEPKKNCGNWLRDCW